VLADGKRCKVTNAVKLHPKLLGFSCDHEFKILNVGALPCEMFYRTRSNHYPTLSRSALRSEFKLPPRHEAELFIRKSVLCKLVSYYQL
jgi:hypothetical protein